MILVAIALFVGCYRFACWMESRRRRPVQTAATAAPREEGDENQDIATEGLGIAPASPMITRDLAFEALLKEHPRLSVWQIDAVLKARRRLRAVR